MATMYQPLLGTRNTSSRKTLCFFLSLAAILCTTTVLATIHLTGLTSSKPTLQGICDHAQDYKASCLAIVSEIASDSTTETSRVHLLQHLLKKSISHLENAIKNTREVSFRINNPRELGALADCVELLELSKDNTKDSIVALQSITSKPKSYKDAPTWLSTILTNHFTCLDGLNGQAKSSLEAELEDLILRARASLAVLVSIDSPPKHTSIIQMKGEFPSWVTPKDRKLLWAKGSEIAANLVVAQDGSGNYTTINDALAAAPNKSSTRFVIYIKAGTYEEHVQVTKNQINIMLVGDGMESTGTIITGSLNFVDGSTTFNSATVAAVGTGFIAQDIRFQNTAGAAKHQAVALRVGADESVINRCQIDGYQDTLYSHSNRQFYTESYIAGTVDFIFGNAAVVFQNCKIACTLPLSNQQNTITAQGKTDPNQNTGTSIQKCNITATSDLEPYLSSIQSYLGRPWKPYSTTVFMQSYIGNLIDPAGWQLWNNNATYAVDTLFYGEYENSGPGSDTSKRVDWPGYHVITNASVAEQFTVAELIQGDTWLTDTGVTFDEGL